MATQFVTRLVRAAMLAVIVAAPLAAQKGRTLEQLQKLSDEELAKVPESEVRDALMLPGLALSATSMSQPFFRGAPGTSSGSPSGFGAAWRDAFVGGGVQQLLSGGTSDGSMSAGFGLGDATNAVGLETTISSLSSFRSGLFERTALSFKVHRMVSPTAAIAVGVENGVVSNKQDEIDPTTVFIAASKVVAGQGRIQRATFSAGIGNGRFRFAKDIREDNKTVNIFASVGLQLHEQFSVLADWGGQDLALGVSAVPFKAFPVILTPTLTDLTNGDPRFSLGAGIGMRF